MWEVFSDWISNTPSGREVVIILLVIVLILARRLIMRWVGRR